MPVCLVRLWHTMMWLLKWMPITTYNRHDIANVERLHRNTAITCTVNSFASTILVAVSLKCIDPTIREQYSRTCHFGVFSAPLCFHQLWYRSIVKKPRQCNCEFLLAYTVWNSRCYCSRVIVVIPRLQSRFLPCSLSLFRRPWHDDWLLQLL